MSRALTGVAMVAALAALVLLASNAAANLGGLPLIGIPLSVPEGAVHGGTPSESNPPQGLSAGAQQEVFSSLIVLGLLFGFAVWRVRKMAPREQGSPFGFVFISLILGMFVLIIVGGRAVTDLLASNLGVKGGTVAYLDPSVIVLATAALAVAIIGASALLSARSWARGRPPPEEPGKALAHEFADVLDRTAYSLRSGSDRRLVVLRCYKALCDVLGEGGASSTPELTAREFETMATEKLALRTGHLHRMTLLFEKARYSSDDVGEEEMEEARESLRELGRELRARPGAAAPGGPVP